MEIRRSYILCERYFRSSVARWWRRGRHPLPRTRIRKAGAGHAPALIINYSGRFGSRLGNEVIFLPGRRQRRRRRHRHLSFRLRLHRPPTSPLSCSRSRRKVFTHVTTSRDSVCKAADTFIRLLCMYTIATHFRVPLMPSRNAVDRRRYLFTKNLSSATFQSRKLGKYRYEKIRGIWAILQMNFS